MPNQESEKLETEQRKIEFKFPLLILRTKKFSTVFDKLGSLRASRYISWIALFFVPFVAGIGIYLIVNSLFALLSNPTVGEVARELGPGAILLLPGINPFLPVVYGWVAIVCAIAIHEGAHGVIARSAGLKVKSSGLLFFLFVPIGAFVDVDEDQIKKAKPRVSLRVMAAGVGGNIVVAIVCILGVIILVNGLTPIVDGAYIASVTDGMPAQRAGLLAKDVFISIDNQTISRVEDLQTSLSNRKTGDLVYVTVARGDKWGDRFSATVNLTMSEGRPVMGVQVGNLRTQDALENYRTLRPMSLFVYLLPPVLSPGAVPFSDSLAPFYTHWLGPQWQILANSLFWLWFVNFNIAIFNALPIYPLDGGRMFNITLKGLMGRRLSEKAISITTFAVTSVCIVILVLITAIPFIM